LGVTVRIRAGVVAAVGLVLVAALGLYIGNRDWTTDLKLPIPGRACTVQAGGEVTLNAEQMAHAATIAAIGMQREMPERAVVVALATAFQESKLENLRGGDRDSVGLFQQRPSQGWGTAKQINDPRYATNKFYAALKKVKGWERMRVTDAAQRVQRSAYPEAYQKWADDATVLTQALLGNATGAVACTVDDDPEIRGAAAAEALVNGLRLDWGRVETAAPTELLGLSVPAANAQTGWRYAHWLVSHATDHGVKRVRFGNLEWTADDGSWTEVGGGEGTRVIAEVFGDA
jgi:hypothetical protein